jgi:hypothetical protein
MLYGGDVMMSLIELSGRLAMNWRLDMHAIVASGGMGGVR